jgi:predicted nucleic-acid-binding Zn-ribbon protein
MSHAGTSFSCSKCHNSQYETEEIRTTGKYSRFFDMQNKKFTAVSCTQCGYTEIFKGDSSKLGNFLDLLTSG